MMAAMKLVLIFLQISINAIILSQNPATSLESKEDEQHHQHQIKNRKKVGKYEMKGAQIRVVHCDLPICNELKSKQTKVNFSLWFYKYDSKRPEERTIRPMMYSGSRLWKLTRNYERGLNVWWFGQKILKSTAQTNNAVHIKFHNFFCIPYLELFDQKNSVRYRYQ